jgi:hypothetical protein
MMTGKEIIKLEELFVAILSFLPQKFTVELEHFDGATHIGDPLSVLQQNKSEVVIEIFFFVYHCLDREIFRFAGSEKRTEILDCIITSAVLDMESVFKWGTSGSMKILNNLNAKQVEYSQYSTIAMEEVHTPCVVNHVARILSDKVKCPALHVPYFHFLLKLYSHILQTMIWISDAEKDKIIPWELSAPANDMEITIVRGLAKTNFCCM